MNDQQNLSAAQPPELTVCHGCDYKDYIVVGPPKCRHPEAQNSGSIIQLVEGAAVSLKCPLQQPSEIQEATKPSVRKLCRGCQHLVRHGNKFPYISRCHHIDAVQDGWIIRNEGRASVSYSCPLLNESKATGGAASTSEQNVKMMPRDQQPKNAGISSPEKPDVHPSLEINLRCEGYRRRGGAFTLGPVPWEQCTNDAIVTITAYQKEEPTEYTGPFCMTCWKEALGNPDIKVLKVVPL